MIFIGYDFFADESALDYVPIPQDTEYKLELNNSVVDELYVSSNITYDMSAVPPSWDFDTAIHAQFNNSLTAGNVDYMVSEVTALRLKRREIGTYEWLTLAEFPVSTIEDMNVTYVDRFAETNKEYEYMLIAITSSVEGSFNSSSVESLFDGIAISEKDTTYRAFVYDYVPTERNQITSVITTLKGRYPYVIKNAETNYTSGQIHAAFFPIVGCEFNYNYLENTAHREELTDFLTNGRPKVIKLDDGRSWIANIVDNVSHSADGLVLYTDFNFVQTGDANNMDDLYDANLIDIQI